uniref:Uncharacterized protein n=1 Tax=Glossina palpalis gambiensis TaxID=67801 RepID=A0A1B0BRV3_9MUSC
MYLLGFVLGLNGAPAFNFALGYCDKYVIIDCSSTLGLTNSSGLMSCLTFNQSSAKPIASEAFCTASLGSQTSQSGHKPGAQASTNAPTALPVVQSLVKLLIETFVWELNQCHSTDFRLHRPTLALKWNNVDGRTGIPKGAKLATLGTEAIYDFPPPLGLSLDMIEVMEKLVNHRTHTGKSY